MNPSVVRERSPGSTDIEEISQIKKRQKIEVDLTIPLCMRCQELDLDAKFEMSFKGYQRVRDKKVALTKGVRKASDGSFYYDDAILVHQFKDRLSKPSDCPLCEFFRPLRVQPERHKCHKLLAFRSSDSWLFRADLLEKQGEFFKEYKDTVFLAVVPDVDIFPPGGYEESWLDIDIPATGAIYRLQMDQSREADPTILLRARELSDKPNLDGVREWLDLCRSIHGSACRRRAIHEPILRSFRLINCAKDPPIVEDQNWGLHMQL